MRPAVRIGLVALASLFLSVVLAPGRCSLAPFPFGAGLQWNLDIERAMDTIGVAPGMVVGEAGAGDGYFTIPMARRVGATGVVLANDIDRRALASLERRSTREHLANIQTVVGSVDDPMFPRQDLQLVVVVHAFHDFSRPVEWLVNLRKYLRPGASVAIIDRDPAQGAESHFLPRERIVEYAREAGYEPITSVDDISAHLILVFRVRGRQQPALSGSTSSFAPDWPGTAASDGASPDQWLPGEHRRRPIRTLAVS